MVLRSVRLGASLKSSQTSGVAVLVTVAMLATGTVDSYIFSGERDDATEVSSEEHNGASGLSRVSQFRPQGLSIDTRVTRPSSQQTHGASWTCDDSFTAHDADNPASAARRIAHGRSHTRRDIGLDGHHSFNWIDLEVLTARCRISIMEESIYDFATKTLEGISDQGIQRSLYTALASLFAVIQGDNFDPESPRTAQQDIDFYIDYLEKRRAALHKVQQILLSCEGGEARCNGLMKLVNKIVFTGDITRSIGEFVDAAMASGQLCKDLKRAKQAWERDPQKCQWEQIEQAKMWKWLITNFFKKIGKNPQAVKTRTYRATITYASRLLEEMTPKADFHFNKSCKGFVAAELNEITHSFGNAIHVPLLDAISREFREHQSSLPEGGLEYLYGKLIEFACIPRVVAYRRAVVEALEGRCDSGKVDELLATREDMLMVRRGVLNEIRGYLENRAEHLLELPPVRVFMESEMLGLALPKTLSPTSNTTEAVEALHFDYLNKLAAICGATKAPMRRADLTPGLRSMLEKVRVPFNEEFHRQLVQMIDGSQHNTLRDRLANEYDYIRSRSFINIMNFVVAMRKIKRQVLKRFAHRLATLRNGAEVKLDANRLVKPANRILKAYMADVKWNSEEVYKCLEKCASSETPVHLDRILTLRKKFYERQDEVLGALCEIIAGLEKAVRIKNWSGQTPADAAACAKVREEVVCDWQSRLLRWIRSSLCVASDNRLRGNSPVEIEEAGAVQSPYKPEMPSSGTWEWLSASLRENVIGLFKERDELLALAKVNPSLINIIKMEIIIACGLTAADQASDSPCCCALNVEELDNQPASEWIKYWYLLVLEHMNGEARLGHDIVSNLLKVDPSKQSIEDLRAQLTRMPWSHHVLARQGWKEFVEAVDTWKTLKAGGKSGLPSTSDLNRFQAYSKIDIAHLARLRRMVEATDSCIEACKAGVDEDVERREELKQRVMREFQNDYRLRALRNVRAEGFLKGLDLWSVTELGGRKKRDRRRLLTLARKFWGVENKILRDFEGCVDKEYDKSKIFSYLSQCREAALNKEKLFKELLGALEQSQEGPLLAAFLERITHTLLPPAAYEESEWKFDTLLNHDGFSVSDSSVSSFTDVINIGFATRMRNLFAMTRSAKIDEGQDAPKFLRSQLPNVTRFLEGSHSLVLLDEVSKEFREYERELPDGGLSHLYSQLTAFACMPRMKAYRDALVAALRGKGDRDECERLTRLRDEIVSERERVRSEIKAYIDKKAPSLSKLPNLQELYNSVNLGFVSPTLITVFEGSRLNDALDRLVRNELPRPTSCLSIWTSSGDFFSADGDANNPVATPLVMLAYALQDSRVAIESECRRRGQAIMDTSPIVQQVADCLKSTIPKIVAVNRPTNLGNVLTPKTHKECISELQQIFNELNTFIYPLSTKNQSPANAAISKLTREDLASQWRQGLIACIEDPDMCLKSVPNNHLTREWVLPKERQTLSRLFKERDELLALAKVNPSLINIIKMEIIMACGLTAADQASGSPCCCSFNVAELDNQPVSEWIKYWYLLVLEHVKNPSTMAHDIVKNFLALDICKRDVNVLKQHVSQMPWSHQTLAMQGWDQFVEAMKIWTAPRSSDESLSPDADDFNRFEVHSQMDISHLTRLKRMVDRPRDGFEAFHRIALIDELTRDRRIRQSRYSKAQSFIASGSDKLPREIKASASAFWKVDRDLLDKTRELIDTVPDDTVHDDAVHERASCKKYLTLCEKAALQKRMRVKRLLKGLDKVKGEFDGIDKLLDLVSEHLSPAIPPPRPQNDIF